MDYTHDLSPRNIIKLAFQYQETEYVPYIVELSEYQKNALTKYYGNFDWQSKVIEYLSVTGGITGVDNFFSLEQGVNSLLDLDKMSVQKDSFGCTWKLGAACHLVSWPLKDQKIGDYRLPDLKNYFEKYIKPRWPNDIKKTKNQFRVIAHSFGLFERAWSLRSFEEFLMDIITNEKFVVELLDNITDWLIQSVDLMAQAPVDAIFFTDDHSYQKGMIMGERKWRKLFKPRWKKIFDRVHYYGLYTVMHMCGDTSSVVPDLIDIGLDCMESCQPEAMDIYALKKKYGKHIRFWGGLGVQKLMAFDTHDSVRQEVKKLKKEMGKGGGYIIAGAKPFENEVPIENIVAYLEEAKLPRK